MHKDGVEIKNLSKIIKVIVTCVIIKGNVLQNIAIMPVK